MKHWFAALVSIVWLIQPVMLSAQSSGVILRAESDNSQMLDRLINWPTDKISKKAVDTKLAEAIENLRLAGYLAAGVDALNCEKDTCTATFYVGRRYAGLQPEIDDSTALLLRPQTIRDLKRTKNLSWNQWLEWQTALATEMGEKGFPAAKIGLKTIGVEDSFLLTKIKINPGQQYLFNEIKLKGEQLVNTSYLSQYLEWKKDETYDHSIFNLVKKRIDDLPFLDLINPPSVVYTYNLADLNLQLKKQKANRFDFLLGVLPGGEFLDRSVIFSVYLNTALYNILGQGEKLDIRFTNTRPETQELILAIDYPYILSLPFGFNGGFELYRNQSTNLDLRYVMGVFYQPDPDLRLGGYYKGISSTALTPDTTFLLREKALPENLDYRFDLIGLSIEANRLDYKLNPTKGWRLGLDVALGLKKIRRQNEFTNLESDSLQVESYYQMLSLNTEQWIIQADGALFWPLSSRFVLTYQLDAGWMSGTNAYLNNELFRIGGSLRLRGFDEEFFRVDGFAVNTFEMRFLLDRNSFFSAFYDAAYLKRRGLNEGFDDFAQGFGMGFNFQTPIGVFNLSYALGKSRTIPFDLNAGKIHFGYVSLF